MVTAITASVASATVPCGGLGECKALVEINSTDGGIGGETAVRLLDQASHDRDDAVQEAANKALKNRLNRVDH